MVKQCRAKFITYLVLGKYHYLLCTKNVASTQTIYRVFSVLSVNLVQKSILLPKIVQKIVWNISRTFYVYFASFNITSVFVYLPLSFPREFQSSSSRQNSVFPDKSITVPCLRMLAQTMEPYLFSIGHKMHPIYYGVDCIIYLKSRIIVGFLFKACQCNCPILIQLVWPPCIVIV